MRLASCIAAVLLACASVPALASATLDCEVTDGSGISVTINMDRDGPGEIRGATLVLGDRTLSTSSTPPQLLVGRTVMTERDIRVELLEPTLANFVAGLDVHVSLDSASAGTLTVDRISHPVTCEFG